MGDIEGGAWFYTREGRQLGPVSHADLRIRAKNSGLDPRLDVVWTKGMSEWRPSGEIEGLFDQATPIIARDGPASMVVTRTLPEHGVVGEEIANEGVWPGARRRSYFFVTLALPLLVGFAVGPATPFLTAKFGEEITTRVTLGIVALTILFMIYWAFRRLLNLGMSRWWIIGYVIPPVGIWVGYRCFACPAGYFFHKNMDGVGIFLAIVYWFVTLVTLLCMAVGIALMMGGIGSPEIQQQFQDALRTVTNPQH